MYDAYTSAFPNRRIQNRCTTIKRFVFSFFRCIKEVSRKTKKNYTNFVYNFHCCCIFCKCRNICGNGEFLVVFFRLVAYMGS